MPGKVTSSFQAHLQVAQSPAALPLGLWTLGGGGCQEAGSGKNLHICWQPWLHLVSRAQGTALWVSGSRCWEGLFPSPQGQSAEWLLQTDVASGVWLPPSKALPALGPLAPRPVARLDTGAAHYQQRMCPDEACAPESWPAWVSAGQVCPMAAAAQAHSLASSSVACGWAGCRVRGMPGQLLA